MKSNWIVISLIGVTVIFSAILVGFYNNNNNAHTPKNITYMSIVLQDQPFYAFIPPKHFKKEFILTDADGDVVQSIFEWRDDSILKIEDLPTGTYTLAVQNVNGTKQEKMTFEVKNMPEKAQNEQQLKDYFRSIKELKAVLAAPFSVSSGGLFESLREEFSMISETKKSTSDTAAGNEPSAEASHSDTNNQVVGIEEGDIAVTNGNYLFSVSDTKVVIVQPEPLSQIGVLSFPENSYIEKLFTYKDLLVVQYMDYLVSTQKTSVQVYDVKDPTNAKLLHTFAQEGYTLNSRILDDQLYLLSSYYVMEENETVPSISTNEEEKAIDIQDISIYPYSMSEEYTVISKLDLTNFDVTTKAFLGASGELYMSENAIYIAATQWQPIPFAMPEIEIDGGTNAMTDRIMPIVNGTGETIIMKYATDKGIEKIAETKIKGTLLNQFSMDEHNGYFRVAATAGNANLNDPQRNSENLLYVFDEQLQEVGKIDNLARGERIYSARFMGDKAYIVTFVETDPLFVLDLQDPTNPKVEGELKIPGYSNYLHPIGEHHLLGIGHDTIVRNDGKNKFVENLGVKLSLFNVADPTNPIEQDVEVIGGAGTTSSVNYSHKGLYRDLTYNRYGFDISVYNGYVYEGSGAAFYEITPNGIDNPQLFIEKAPGEQYEDWNKTVKRILFVNDKTFILSNSEVKSLDRATLQLLESIEIN